MNRCKQLNIENKFNLKHEEDMKQWAGNKTVKRNHCLPWTIKNIHIESQVLTFHQSMHISNHGCNWKTWGQNSSTPIYNTHILQKLKMGQCWVILISYSLLLSESKLIPKSYVAFTWQDVVMTLLLLHHVGILKLQ